MAKVRKLFKFHKSTTDLSEWNKNDDKLLKAVERGDIGKVESLLTKKTLMPTKPGPKGLSVFHWAALSGQLPILELFLSHGVDINCTDLLGHTALHLASKYGWPLMVDKLLQLGANKQTHDSDHMTAIHHACGSCQLACVEVLIRHGTSVNVKDKSGRTPMFYCAQSGELAMCKLLLDHGADPNIQDHLSRTALIFAAGKGHKNVCELLLRRGADADYKDKEGVRAIDYAVRGGHNLKELFDKAPTRASWDVGTENNGATNSNEVDGSKSTLLNDIVRQFSGEESPELGKTTISPQKSKEVHSSGSSNQNSPHSRETTPNTNKEQRTQEEYKELEEEHDLLTEELRVLRIAHIKLKDKVAFLTERTQNKHTGETQKEDSQRLQQLEEELKRAKELYVKEQEKTSELEHNLEILDEKLHKLSESPVGSPGLSDNWGDSDEELFTDSKHSKEKDKQVIALLKSQMLTLQKENDCLKDKLQSEHGPESPSLITRVTQQTVSSAITDEGLLNGTDDLNGLKKEKLDLIHEIDKLKEEASSLRQSPLTQSVSVFSEGESGIHMNGDRSRTPSEEGDQSSKDLSKYEEECQSLKETIKKMEVSYSALVEAGDKLQIQFDEQYNEKLRLEEQLQEVIQDKEDLLRENDFLAADNLHEDLERLISELETLQEKNKILEQEKEDLEKRLQSNNNNGSSYDELEEKYTQLKQDHEIVIEEIQSVQEQYSEIQTERDQLQQDLDMSQDELDKLTQNFEVIQQEYGQLEQDYAELLSDKGKLEKEFLDFETSRARDFTDSSLTQQNHEILTQQNSILTNEKNFLESKVIELESANDKLLREIENLKYKVSMPEIQSEQNIKLNSIPTQSEKDKQVRSLQIKISRLQQKVMEMERKHKDTVNTYRTHLVSAVQGHMDPEVKEAIHQIIQMRSTEQFC